MNLKCVKKEMNFDGVNFVFRNKVIGKAPKDWLIKKEIPKKKMDAIKDSIIQNICGV